jgi:hypothetical protein
MPREGGRGFDRADSTTGNSTETTDHEEDGRSGSSEGHLDSTRIGALRPDPNPPFTASAVGRLAGKSMERPKIGRSGT